MQIQSDLIVKNGSTEISAGAEKAKVSSETSLFRMRLPANSAGSEDALHQLQNNVQELAELQGRLRFMVRELGSLMRR